MPNDGYGRESILMNIRDLMRVFTKVFLAGKFLHVDLDDCTLMGFKALGAPDGDLFSYELVGDQSTWGLVRVAQYAGPMREFFIRHFPENFPTIKFTAATDK
jgi:hypothetical protein